MNLNEKVDKVEKELHEVSLATEIIKDLKAQVNKRTKINVILSIVIAILSCIIIGLIVFYFKHEAQYETINGEQTILDGRSGIVTYLENSSSGDIDYAKNN